MSTRTAQTTTKPDDVPIHVALSRVMESAGAVGKNSRNQQQGFSFRGIDAVVNAVSPALREHGVVVLPETLHVERGTVEVGNNRTVMGHVAVRVRYTFVGPQGDSLSCITEGEAMDSGDKATAKAYSVAFRIALLQTLALPTDDTDPDAQTYDRSPRGEQRRADPPPPPPLEQALDVLRNATTLDTVARLGHDLLPHSDHYGPEGVAALREAAAEAKTRIEAEQAQAAAEQTGGA